MFIAKCSKQNYYPVTNLITCGQLDSKTFDKKFSISMYYYSYYYYLISNLEFIFHIVVLCLWLSISLKIKNNWVSVIADRVVRRKVLRTYHMFVTPVSFCLSRKSSENSVAIKKRAFIICSIVPKKEIIHNFLGLFQKDKVSGYWMLCWKVPFSNKKLFLIWIESLKNNFRVRGFNIYLPLWIIQASFW